LKSALLRRRSALLSFAGLACAPAQALYDPKPSTLLADAVGDWRGSLTYRDYQNPDRMVTLPTRTVITLGAPAELTLYYVFDDGPGKVVYSYERMTFDFEKQQLAWVFGLTPAKPKNYRITSAVAAEGVSRIGFESPSDAGSDRYALEISPRRLTMTKTEIKAGSPELLRSTYAFAKAAG
jgi:hypothetical protein